ncbi:hypothetical protein TSUD_360220 [Trifolium subterraneum]|uniref:Uncharacterized protein n=1 Tax=Trifolium subterraneum TaxID=3900 RepID=A0A2Z6NEL6_TRISU|nr:hypothetical protein TSUD_360220 [Trifolium subterraneum]
MLPTTMHSTPLALIHSNAPAKYTMVSNAAVEYVVVGDATSRYTVVYNTMA